MHCDVYNKKSQPSYIIVLQNASVQRTDAQKDLGISKCKDLKWTCYVLEAASKANRMLGFIRRSTLEVKIQSTRKALYKALVMSNLSNSSQVWASQSVKLIEIIARVQRHVTNYILSLPYRTDISYKERLRLHTSLLVAQIPRSSFSNQNIKKGRQGTPLPHTTG